MAQRWIDTAGADNAEARVEGFWVQQKQDLNNGEFWADRIKRYRQEPDKRLKAALNELPLPAAFRQAAIALRSLIRTKRKTKEPFQSDLAFLYWLAAINSLMIPYSERLGQPGFNVMESIPGDRIRSITFDYQTLGHSHLELLNITDRKWLVETWGEPKSHSTLNVLCQDLWREFENRLMSKRHQREEQLVNELRSCLQLSSTKPIANPPKKGLFSRLFGL